VTLPAPPCAISKGCELGDLVRDLQGTSEELIETHISWVFLRSREVFKLKKPVNFGFLDFSDLASREGACHAEVELNSRLAPGIYRGVLPVRRDARGQHAIDGAGEVVDYVVVMSRLPAQARADLKLERGELTLAHVDTVARLLARFHARAARGGRISEFGGVDVIRANVEENFAQARALLVELVPEAVEREVEVRQLGFLEKQAELFARRVAQGYVRDGHGDLRLEHVYLADGADPVIIDCIEFNERFRFADVCSDLAFLSMDLGCLGRLDLKERLLSTYARESGDHDLFALVDFYESYRAYVRAKVSAFTLASGSLSYTERAKLEAEARRYLLVALAAERPALTAPRLVAVGGLIASGKSSLATALGDATGAIVISSDETRKRLHGAEPTTPLHDPRQTGAWQDAYAPEASRRVYTELLRRARLVLESGRSVILDASFRSSDDREAARGLASSLGASFNFVECRATDEVARARLAERARGPSVSDGNLEIYADFAARYEPVTELDPAEYLLVDTSGALERSLAQLQPALSGAGSVFRAMPAMATSPASTPSGATPPSGRP
jgi:aminoglycoside phosphotransferase family enzyme/predicted kinase